MANTTVILLHGANASARCWNYIARSIAVKVVTIEYSSANSFRSNLESISQEVSAVEGDLIFIGHSLGGIYAVHLAHIFSDRTRALVSISTPYGGIEVAGMIRLLYPATKLFKDVLPTSKPITDAVKMLQTTPVPALQIVTTRGSAPWFPYPNDGVVSIKSQRAAENIVTATLDTNHYEVLLHPETIEILRGFLANCNLPVIETQ